MKNYYLRDDIETHVISIIEHYNHQPSVLPRESGNLAPADVCFGGGPEILTERLHLKRKTISSPLAAPQADRIARHAIMIYRGAPVLYPLLDRYGGHLGGRDAHDVCTGAS